MNDDHLLLRQIHPSFIQGGRVTSQAFRPTPKDRNQLSTYDGALIEAEPAWRHYTEQLGLRSHGVMAVERDECARLSLPVRPDPGSFPEHVLIDFRGFSKREIESKAKELRRGAEVRGWLYQDS